MCIGESSDSKGFQETWTPFSNGVTTFYEAINFDGMVIGISAVIPAPNKLRINCALSQINTGSCKKPGSRIESGMTDQGPG
jgi:hypothetical protein